MKTWFLRLWTDADYFVSVMAKMRTWLAGLLAMLALGITTGQISLGPLGDKAGLIMLFAAFVVHGRSQPVLQQVQAMTPETKAAVTQELKPGPPAPREGYVK